MSFNVQMSINKNLLPFKSLQKCWDFLFDFFQFDVKISPESALILPLLNNHGLFGNIKVNLDMF